ncbi:MAG: serine protease, partial [Pirellulaceae bacterium]|nr:serine protease [Pirellulaceae bacterium]
MIFTLRTTQTRISVLAVVLLLCTSTVHAVDVASSVLSAQAKRIAAIRKASASTVMVFAAGGNGGGSGVLISPEGYALS